MILLRNNKKGTGYINAQVVQDKIIGPYEKVDSYVEKVPILSGATEKSRKRGRDVVKIIKNLNNE